MPSSPLVDAVNAYRRSAAHIEAARENAAKLIEAAVARRDKAREALAQAIVAAGRDGWRIRDLVKVTGYSRERIRQILRAGGVEAD